jgi:hypothetical protein
MSLPGKRGWALPTFRSSGLLLLLPVEQSVRGKVLVAGPNRAGFSSHLVLVL